MFSQTQWASKTFIFATQMHKSLLSTFNIAASYRTCTVSIEAPRISEHVRVEIKYRGRSAIAAVPPRTSGGGSVGRCSPTNHQRLHVNGSTSGFRLELDLSDRSAASRTKRNQNKRTQMSFRRKSSTNTRGQIKAGAAFHAVPSDRHGEGQTPNTPTGPRYRGES